MMKYVVCSMAVLFLVATAAPAHEGHPSGAGEIMFERFPTHPGLYQPPVAKLIEEGIVEKYGLEEFAAVVLTNELHQHVGIYTVLGAKMGVRAREVLQAPARQVKAVMETTTEQPFACALDGIQMALGSTFGQNLIEVADNEEPAIAGTFTWAARRVRITLDPEYQAKLKGMIMAAREKHGDLTPAYFDEIAVRCYEVWAAWDRVTVFKIEMTRLEEAAETAK